MNKRCNKYKENTSLYITDSLYHNCSFNRQKRNIITVNRQMNKPVLSVKCLR